MIRCRPTIAVAVLVGYLLLSTPAKSQEPAMLDPQSPAGVEYALPLEQARKDAVPNGSKGDSGAGSGGEAPLFGAGIAPRGRTVAEATGGTGGAADNGGAPDDGGVDEVGSTSRREDRRNRTSGSDPALKGPSVAAANAENGSPTLPIIGIAFAVLLVGALLGLLLRHWLREPSG